MGIDVRQIKRGNVNGRTVGETEGTNGEQSFVVRLLNKELLPTQKLNTKQKARFYAEIGTLLEAGVDLHSILTMVSENNGNTKHGMVYRQIAGEVLKGASIGDAMQSTGHFNNFDCYSVLIGESTGEIAVVFKRLSEYYTRKITRQRKIKGALSYPVIVLCTAVGAIYFMLKFVVPMFSRTLITFGGELPELTRIIINLSQHVSFYFLLIIGFAVGAYILWYKNRDNEKLKLFVATLLLKIPYIGKYIYKAHLLEFTTAMSLLLNSKVNIVESLSLVEKIISFYPLTISVRNIRKDIVDGDFFYRSMGKQHFFESGMITMVKIGEEVNQLDQIFSQLSKQYEEELEYQSSVFMSVLEPLIILILAAIVGVILIAMYLPMFKIGSVLH